MVSNDQQYMQLALDLAESAMGRTNPNPLVGAVIVKDGVIVGTGLHRKAGEPHAEVHAVRMAGEHAVDATIYVTLEPCSHYGKTPPCANLLVESGVKRVVVAMQDPNPSVAGRGIKLLRDAGIEVEVGLLEKQARRLNERFIHNMLTLRPFVISKFAMTLDGKIATYNGHSKWITDEGARQDVHELRDKVDAILVGVGTVLKDNPSLTTRLADRMGKNPIRIILDSNLRTPLHANVCDTSQARTIIVTASEKQGAEYETAGVDILRVSMQDGKLHLEEMLEKLYQMGITDLLVEGGGEINASFLRKRLIQKFLIYVAPKILGGRNSITPFTGEDAETIDEAMLVDFGEIMKIGQDIRMTAYPKEV